MTEYTRQGEFIAGVKAMFPLMLSSIPFAIIFGASAVTGGLSPAAVMGMSLVVFAGSAQFIGSNLFAQGAPLLVIVVTTFVVNLRHALYGASLAPYVKHLSQRWLLPLSFTLTDETYAIVIRRYQTDQESPYLHWYYFGSGMAMYVNWQIWTLVGILAGQRFEGLGALGLDFAMVVTFIGIVVPLVINRPMLVCAVVAGIVGVASYNLPNKLGLMVAAVAGIAAGMIVESWNQQNTAESVEVIHE